MLQKHHFFEDGNSETMESCVKDFYHRKIFQEPAQTQNYVVAESESFIVITGISPYRTLQVRLLLTPRLG